VPTEEDIQGIVSQRVIASLEATLRSRDSMERERMRRFISLGRSLAEAEEESPLIAMLLDDYYQRTLQAPLQSPTGEAVEDEAVEETAMPAAEKPGGKMRKRPPRRRSGPRRGGWGGEGAPPPA
jgi:ATP-dependent RNA helicase DeaD